MTPAILDVTAFRPLRNLEWPVCPSCGDRLMAAQAAALVAGHHIRNCWSCDRCGHDFVTAVQLTGAALDDDD